MVYIMWLEELWPCLDSLMDPCHQLHNDISPLPWVKGIRIDCRPYLVLRFRFIR